LVWSTAPIAPSIRIFQDLGDLALDHALLLTARE
jgi:hypothetical protein